MNYRAAWTALTTLALGAALAPAADKAWTLTSPKGQLAVTVSLIENGRLQYRVEHGAEAERIEVVRAAPLGIVRDDQSFAEGLRLVERGEPRDIDESYTMPHGKRRACRHLAREQVLGFASENGTRVDLVVRAANDGVAFRYRFPGQGAEPRVVKRELTGFTIPQGARGWIQPYDKATQWTPAYELYYDEVDSGAPAPGAEGWAFPALFKLPQGNRWVLVTEAATDETYCGCRLAQEAPGGVYQIRFPDPGEGNGQGEVEPRSTLPWATPWRVILVSEGLGGIVESTLIQDLNPPSQVADTNWIKPGRVAWSWWSNHDSPRDYAKQQAFVDLAAEMGWEYCLVDANWDLMNGGNVRELAKYAQEKNVGLLLWYNSGGDHNIVTERPRGVMNLAPVRQFEFKLLRQWGVRGIKVDFFQSDKQNIMDLYHGILKDAAEARIMMNFHGCTLPRGWSRTWPHLMTMEAVKGAENYTFAPEYAEKAPRFNTIVPFTRNVVGPMDYTPVVVSKQHPRTTTVGHELALAVVFESGWLHFADSVAAYQALPVEAKDFLRHVPVAWDETRYLDGEPGKRAAIARRHGDGWWIGAISGENASSSVAIPLAFLGEDKYEATLIADGADVGRVGTKKLAVSAEGKLTLDLPARGGAVVVLRRNR